MSATKEIGKTISPHGSGSENGDEFDTNDEELRNLDMSQFNSPGTFSAKVHNPYKKAKPSPAHASLARASDHGPTESTPKSTIRNPYAEIRSPSNMTPRASQLGNLTTSPAISNTSITWSSVGTSGHNLRTFLHAMYQTRCHFCQQFIKIGSIIEKYVIISTEGGFMETHHHPYDHCMETSTPPSDEQFGMPFNGRSYQKIGPGQFVLIHGTELGLDSPSRTNSAPAWASTPVTRNIDDSSVKSLPADMAMPQLKSSGRERAQHLQPRFSSYMLGGRQSPAASELTNRTAAALHHSPPAHRGHNVDGASTPDRFCIIKEALHATSDRAYASPSAKIHDMVQYIQCNNLGSTSEGIQAISMIQSNDFDVSEQIQPRDLQADFGNHSSSAKSSHDDTNTPFANEKDDMIQHGPSEVRFEHAVRYINAHC